MITVDELFYMGDCIEQECFSGALMPAETAFWVYCYWSWLGGAPLCSEDSHWVCLVWGLLEEACCRPWSTTAYAGLVTA